MLSVIYVNTASTPSYGYGAIIESLLLESEKE